VIESVKVMRVYNEKIYEAQKISPVNDNLDAFKNIKILLSEIRLLYYYGFIYIMAFLN